MCKTEIFFVFSVLLLCVSAKGLQTITKEAKIGVLQRETVNSSVQFLFHFTTKNYSGLRLHTYSATADKDVPVIVTVREELGVPGVDSWQLPLFVPKSNGSEYDHYPMVNRTLCLIDYHPTLQNSKYSDEFDIYVTVSTFSPNNTEFQIEMYHQEVFVIKEFDKNFETQVSPSSPIYYEVHLPCDVNSAFIEFYSKDEVNFQLKVTKYSLLYTFYFLQICATFSVQNQACPIFFSQFGIYQSFSTKAGITLLRDTPCNTFVLVFEVQDDDFLCNESFSSSNNTSRVKNIYFSVKKTITEDEKSQAIWVIIGTIAGVFVLILVVIVCVDKMKSKCCRDTGNSQGTGEMENAEDQFQDNIPLVNHSEPNSDSVTDKSCNYVLMMVIAALLYSIPGNIFYPFYNNFRLLFGSLL